MYCKNCLTAFKKSSNIMQYITGNMSSRLSRITNVWVLICNSSSSRFLCFLYSVKILNPLFRLNNESIPQIINEVRFDAVDPITMAKYKEWKEATLHVTENLADSSYSPFAFPTILFLTFL